MCQIQTQTHPDTFDPIADSRPCTCNRRTAESNCRRPCTKDAGFPLERRFQRRNLRPVRFHSSLDLSVFPWSEPSSQSHWDSWHSRLWWQSTTNRRPDREKQSRLPSATRECVELPCWWWPGGRKKKPRSVRDFHFKAAQRPTKRPWYAKWR